MSVLATVDRGRVAAERLMVDEATVSRPGEPTFNPDTGLLEPASSTVLYSGKCRLRQPSAQETQVLFGEQQTTTTRFIACFPHDADGFEIGDIVTFTESHDPDVLAASLQIMAVPIATFTIYKGYPCEVAE